MRYTPGVSACLPSIATTKMLRRLIAKKSPEVAAEPSVSLPGDNHGDADQNGCFAVLRSDAR